MNRSSVFHRFFFVMIITSLIALILWSLQSKACLDQQLVYAYATALPIWFLSDVIRRRLFPAPADGVWTKGRRVKAFIFISIAIGFVFGTWVGDWYSGFSTLDLLKFAPQKLVGFIILCVSISAAFTVFFYQQNRLQVVEKQATESKLQLLQSQLEPHMLFNTLANLRVLIDLDAVRAQAMLDRLIDYLRATLGASRVTTHALALEFDRLDDYLALMQVRMGERLRYSLSLPDGLNDTPCPALLLQPLVENAVLHGLEPSAQGGEVRVAAAQVGQQLILTVTDTGLGFDGASSAGFGLTQIRERLQTLHGSVASVAIAPHTPNGTVVTISLPLSTDPTILKHCRVRSYVQSSYR